MKYINYKNQNLGIKLSLLILRCKDMGKVMVIFLVATLLVGLASANPYVISVNEAYQLLNKENTIFIDSEDSQTYQKAHIPSAVNIDSLSLQDIAIKNNEKQK
ncbi:MAG: rhodanese-like domain-containing protein, partial [Hydrogenothermaceae bacterium]